MEEKNFKTGILMGVMSTITIVSVIIMILAFTLGDNLRYVENTSATSTIDDSKEEIIEKIGYLASEIQVNSLYDVKDEDIIEGIYKGIFSSIGDDYAAYYTAEEYKELTEDIQGVYYGIGAYIAEDAEKGEIYISKPIPGSPAEEAGLLPDDVIVKVDGKDALGVDSDTVVSWIKGPEGTKVMLTLYREGETDYLEIEVERRKIEVDTVEYKELETGIGYIAISQFDTITTKQFKEAIKKAEDNKNKGVIIDLRSNPGGSLATVIEMSDMFLPVGKAIVSTKDKGETNEIVYRAETEDKFDMPMVVLINGYSASASEIFAAVIKDYDLGTLVGTTTFGKGIVQTSKQLADGSAIKLTTSNYYTPNGECIHEKGIEPDIEIEFDAEKYYDTKEDNQLDKALEVLKKEILSK